MADDEGDGGDLRADLLQFGEAASASLNSIDAATAKASGDERIVGYVASLAEVMNVLRAIPGFGNCRLTLLSDLMLRLDDLSHGKKASMQELLDAVKISGRPRHAWRDDMRESRAAGAVEFLIEQGWEELDACHCIAKALTKAGVKGRRTDSVSGETVRGWLYKPRAEREIDRSTLANLRAMASITGQMDKPTTRRFMERFFAAGEFS